MSESGHTIPPGASPLRHWRKSIDRIVDSPRTPRVAMVIGVLMTVLVTWLAIDTTRQADARLVVESADRVLDRLAEELVEYDSLIKVSSHMVSATTADPLEGIRGYLVGNTLSRFYPATAFLAFVRRVPAQGLADYQKSIRAQLATDENGISSLDIRPVRPATEYFFVESAASLRPGAPPRGTEVGASAILAEAITRARTGDSTVLTTWPALGSQWPTLVTPVNNPIARKGQDVLVGVLLLGIDAQRLVEGVLAEQDAGSWRVRLSARRVDDRNAVGAATLVYENREWNAASWNHPTVERDATFGNTVMKLEVSPSILPTQDLALQFLPPAAFLACIAIAWLSVQLLLRMQAARLQAESMARQSQERFQALVESSNDWIWEVDRDYRITYASPICTRMLGRSPDQLVGQAIDALGTPGKGGSLLPFSRDNPQGYTAFERNFLRPDGSTVITESSATCILDAGGRFAGLRGIDRDVTEQHAIRERLAALGEELSSSMRANLVSQLLTGLAHELNQPLGAIASYNQASMRLLKQPSPDMDEIIRAMQSTANHALLAGEIIKGLRRMTTQRKPLVERVKVGPLLENAIRLVEHRLRLGGVTADTDIAADLPEVLADRILLLQVCLNLLHNAIDALAEVPERRIRISARETADHFVEITFADSGVGLSAEAAERVFDPRYTTKREGMGMGLTISRSIMDALHGEISAAPGAHGGSVFTLRLPAHRESGTSTALPSGAMKTTASTPHSTADGMR